MCSEYRLRIAVPSRGRLREGAEEILSMAGIGLPSLYDRMLVTDDEGSGYQLQFVRARDIVSLVATGCADVGITGRDLVMEFGEDSVEEIMKLDFGKCSLCIAVPEDSPAKDASELEEGARIATMYPRVTSRFFENIGKKVEIVTVSGTTEAAPMIGIADAISDIVETGSTLRMNGLRPLCRVLESSAVVIAGKDSRMKRDEIDEFLCLVRSVQYAKSKRYLMVNVPYRSENEVLRLLKGIEGPTSMRISGRNDFFALHAVVDISEINAIIPGLKALGCTGVLVSRIERLVP
ncbi:MAG: ATP phosphoribosyltransferase [Thermoplasmata archaeon]|uniref:ATP phosphoribosyltransferase n=1 Tax=Candidatus Sysuiplasma superficiale TaxID=2823368 RepID=A0A8J8CFN3_9ARCH|nr:ATP phosphoribosyltransferase [Candidatus Sysuiplasma superficiale]MBX8643601.1 ATP phosphoribosyltransferase [Candidatus Sysuiplasma superficiale]